MKTSMLVVPLLAILAAVVPPAAHGGDPPLAGPSAESPPSTAATVAATRPSRERDPLVVLRGLAQRLPDREIFLAYLDSQGTSPEARRQLWLRVAHQLPSQLLEASAVLPPPLRSEVVGVALARLGGCGDGERPPVTLEEPNEARTLLAAARGSAPCQST